MIRLQAMLALVSANVALVNQRSVFFSISDWSVTFASPSDVSVRSVPRTVRLMRISDSMEFLKIWHTKMSSFKKPEKSALTKFGESTLSGPPNTTHWHAKFVWCSNMETADIFVILFEVISNNPVMHLLSKNVGLSGRAPIPAPVPPPRECVIWNL